MKKVCKDQYQTENSGSQEWGLEMAIKVYLCLIRKFVNKKRLFMYVISVQLKNYI